ncbi:MAG: L-asparaginase [Trebonia sp.]|jgi:L-asparaginase|nr:L-asparaginase [Streptosporangiaceae bacterium]MDX6418439.1 L-asparaginase [Trebonia sp.]
MSSLPRVAVFALGGTIASSADSGAAATVRLTGQELLSGVPEASDVAALEVHSIRMVPSGDLRLTDLFELRSLVEEAARTGVDGIVVTQGTDTLEETSYAFELLTSLDVPVVFTGAMRNSSLPGSDGPANLLTAIRVAASPAARGLGTVVVFNDEIHASRQVRKRHASSTATFGSPLTGPLGHVSEDRVRILVRPNGRFHVRVPPGAPGARVGQATVFFDDDGGLIEAAPVAGYQGLVLAAFGGGHVPSWIMPILRKVAAQIPVVVASRTNAGEGLRSTYAYPGSEIDLISNGLVPAVGIDTAHATVLLRLLLMAGVEADAFAWCFEQASNPHGLVTVSANPRLA